MDYSMKNELTTIDRPATELMTTERRAANLEALLSSLSANTQAQIASTWKLYSQWCALAGASIWELDAV